MFDLATVQFPDDASNASIFEHACKVLDKHLRDYQSEATMACVRAATKTVKPLLLEIPTGGGKSWICVSIAYVMSLLFMHAGHRNRRTLIICPSDTLVEQNAEKLKRAGGDVAIFCASLKLKQTEGTIIVGTPMSIANSIDLFATLNIGCVIVDEAHIHADTSKSVVAALKAQNERLREFGMTATPYRTAEKYIYHVNSFERKKPNTPELAVNPYYDQLVYRVEGSRLVHEGYLVPMLIKPIGMHYDTSLLKMGTGGKFTAESEREVFIEHNTNVAIVNDMLPSTKPHKMIMVFCQNIEHAELIFKLVSEKLAENPEYGTAVLYHSKIEKEDARARLDSFSAGKHRFMISVRSLTTGYDNERVDAIVVLSTTESASLMVQIIGRGMRPIISDRRFKKSHCGLYDYGENLQRHFPDGDLFNPFIRPVGGASKTKATLLNFHCPLCNQIGKAAESVWHLPMKNDGNTVNDNGYFTDKEGITLVCSQTQRPIAAHIQTRCNGIKELPDGTVQTCDHTWESQLCHNCGALNANHHDECQYCAADFKERRRQEREGRESMTSMHSRIPKAFESTGLHELISAKVNSYKLVFEERKDQYGENYLSCAVTMKLKVSARYVVQKGKFKVVPEREETIIVRFDEHFDFNRNSKQKKKDLMKAIWGYEMDMVDAKETEPARDLKDIEYCWMKSKKGARYVEVLRITSKPKKQVLLPGQQIALPVT